MTLGAFQPVAARRAFFSSRGQSIDSCLTYCTYTIPPNALIVVPRSVRYSCDRARSSHGSRTSPAQNVRCHGVFATSATLMTPAASFSESPIAVVPRRVHSGERPKSITKKSESVQTFRPSAGLAPCRRTFMWGTEGADIRTEAAEAGIRSISHRSKKRDTRGRKRAAFARPRIIARYEHVRWICRFTRCLTCAWPH
jgi:hypothetical protein